MNEILQAWRSADRNKIALLLSVVPGLGHIFKRHYFTGAALLIGGNLLMVFCALWLFIATAGLSMIVVPLFYYVVVAASAYRAPDWYGKSAALAPWRGRSPAERGKTPAPRQPTEPPEA